MTKNWAPKQWSKDLLQAFFVRNLFCKKMFPTFRNPNIFFHPILELDAVSNFWKHQKVDVECRCEGSEKWATKRVEMRAAAAAAGTPQLPFNSLVFVSGYQPKPKELLSPYIALISVFRLTDGAARILPWFLSFTSPITSINAGAGDNKDCVRERVHMTGVPEKIGAVKIFGHIWVWTLATCMAGKCFIHCAMPLGQPNLTKPII